jgi:hypothetical protein
MLGPTMVPVRLTMTLEGEAVIDRVLSGIEQRANDLRPAWPAVVQAFQAITAKAFTTEGASTGAPWKPLAPSTQADRQRHGFAPAHPILQRSGTLMHALTTGEGAFASMQPTSLTYRLSGDPARYFKYHQSQAPRTKLPRRAPVELTADDKTALVHPVRLYLTGRDPNALRRAPIR